MSALELIPFDPADYLNSTEDIILYLDAVLKDGDDLELLSAINDIARSKGMTRLASETGLSRAGIYKALSPEGNPSFTTMRLILGCLGLELSVSRRAVA